MVDFDLRLLNALRHANSRIIYRIVFTDNLSDRCLVALFIILIWLEVPRDSRGDYKIDVRELHDSFIQSKLRWLDLKAEICCAILYRASFDLDMGRVRTLSSFVQLILHRLAVHLTQLRERVNQCPAVN